MITKRFLCKLLKMKYISVILILVLLIMASCADRKQSKNNFIIVDMAQVPSTKKELILQDFMDVEYIALETKDDFYNQGFVQSIGKEILLVKNRNDDGDIFVYDRTGKALRKINRKGQGGEEYLSIYNIILDENREEIFVNDLFKIVVYDLYGNFKRSFKYKETSGTIFYSDIFNYDIDNLLCYDPFNKKIAFLLISKLDGSITKEIEIPFKEKIFLRQQFKDESKNMVYTAMPDPYRTLTPYNGNWILFESSSDTVYTFFPDYSLHPFIVRTPPIQFMDPKVFLSFRLLSDRYYFMETIKNVYDFNSGSGFPKTFFMYDKLEKDFFRYSLYNGDYLIKKEVFMSLTKPVNQEIESWYPLNAFQLVDSYKKGELRGKLKEIAATLNEESNSVIMLIKHKK